MQIAYDFSFKMLHLLIPLHIREKQKANSTVSYLFLNTGISTLQ